MLVKLVTREFSEKGKAVYVSELPREVVVEFVVGAFLSVFELLPNPLRSSSK